MKIDSAKFLKTLLKSNRSVEELGDLYRIPLLNESVKRVARKPLGQSCNIAGSYLSKAPQPNALVFNYGEKKAVSEYMNSESYKLNDQLRNDVSLSPRHQNLVKNLDSALEKVPVYRNMTWRNITLDRLSDEEYNNFIKQHKEGNIVKYPAYTSTSKDPAGYETSGNKTVHMAIEGKSGRDISNYGIGISAEQEVLFKRNTKFQVMNAAMYEDGRTFLRLKEVDKD